jgi:hypothetical protein
MQEDDNMRPEIARSSALLNNTEVAQAVVARGGSLDDVLSQLRNVERVRRGHADEDLALALECGYAVLAAVDVGVLENDPSQFGRGEYNALVWVWGLQRNAESGEIQFVVVSRPDFPAPVAMAAVQFFSAWLPAGGWLAEVLP